MIPRLYSSLTAALVLTLLLGACSKKDVAVINAGSYVLDGRTVSCQATQKTSTSSGSDYLYVILTTTPQPSSGPEELQLNFVKLTGQGNSAYQLMALGGIGLNKSSSIQGLGFQNTTCTKTFTSSGSISGTFTGEVLAVPGLSSTTHTLTDGTFTDVRP